jgi:hypothetical protein
MHHIMRANTRVDIIATKMRVETVEIVKQKSNSAKENITILFMKKIFINVNQVYHLRRHKMTYDHISNAQGRLI